SRPSGRGGAAAAGPCQASHPEVDRPQALRQNGNHVPGVCRAVRARVEAPQVIAAFGPSVKTAAGSPDLFSRMCADTHSRWVPCPRFGVDMLDRSPGPKALF